MSELSLCLFCGKHPETDKVPITSGIFEWQIGCSSSKCSTSHVYVTGDTYEEAVTLWNTRYVPPVDTNTTKACPACGNALKLPTEYLNSFKALKAHTDAFIPVLELDLILQISRGVERLRRPILEPQVFNSGYNSGLDEVLNMLKDLEKECK